MLKSNQGLTKDSDYSLVSNKNFQSKNSLLQLGSGPGNLGQKSMNVPNYDVTHKKTKTKTFQFKKSKLEDLRHLLRVGTTL